MSDTTATMFDAAFRLLEPELSKIPGSPKTLSGFVARLTQSSMEPAAKDKAAAEKMLSPDAAADLLGVCKQTVLNMVKDKRLPCIRLGSQIVRIPYSAISSLVETGGGAK